MGPSFSSCFVENEDFEFIGGETPYQQGERAERFYSVLFCPPMTYHVLFTEPVVEPEISIAI